MRRIGLLAGYVFIAGAARQAPHHTKHQQAICFLPFDHYHLVSFHRDEAGLTLVAPSVCRLSSVFCFEPRLFPSSPPAPAPVVGKGVVRSFSYYPHAPPRPFLFCAQAGGSRLLLFISIAPVRAALLFPPPLVPQPVPLAPGYLSTLYYHCWPFEISCAAPAATAAVAVAVSHRPPPRESVRRQGTIHPRAPRRRV